MNKIWTFQQRSSAINDQLVRFALVISLGILYNDAFLWLSTTLFTSLSLNVAKISAIASSVAVFYIGMRFGFNKHQAILI